MTLERAVVLYAEALWMRDVPWYKQAGEPSSPMSHTDEEAQHEHAAPHAAFLRAAGVPIPSDTEIEAARLAVVAAVLAECER